MARTLELRLDPRRDGQLLAEEDGPVGADLLDADVDLRADAELGVPRSRQAEAGLLAEPQPAGTLAVDVVLRGHRGPVRHEAVDVQDAVTNLTVEHVGERRRGLGGEGISPEAHAELLVEGADLASDDVLATDLSREPEVLHTGVPPSDHL